MTSAISPRSGASAAGDSPGTFVEAGGLSVGAFMAPKTSPRDTGCARRAQPTTPLWAARLFGIVGHLMWMCLFSLTPEDNHALHPSILARRYTDRADRRHLRCLRCTRTAGVSRRDGDDHGLMDGSVTPPRPDGYRRAKGQARGARLGRLR